MDKGETVKATYAHVIDSTTVVAAEASHPVHSSGPMSIVVGQVSGLSYSACTSHPLG